MTTVPGSDDRPRFLQLRRKSTLLGSAAALAAAVVSVYAIASWAEISFNDFSLPVQNGPVRLGVSDCTNDGIPDVVVANQGSSNVTILRNLGDGTFAFWRTIPVSLTQPTPVETPGSFPTPKPIFTPGLGQLSSAVCGDFTGDGIIDLAIAIRRDPGIVQIFTADAGGTFTALPRLETEGFSPNALSAADLNDDGKLDLVVVNANSNDMTILLGDGAGGFSSVSTVPVPGVDHHNRPSSAAVADFDLNGQLDIAVVSKGDPSLRLYLGDGAGGFQLFGGTLPAPLDPHAVAAADVDNDGIPDLAVLTADSTVTFYAGTGTGTFVPLTSLVIPSGTPDIGLADFDDDGLQDLAIAYYTFNDVQVLLAVGPAQFPASARIGAGNRALGEAVNPFGASVLRATDDGTELISSNTETHSLDLLTLPDLESPPTFAPLLTLPDQPETVLLADMNNDSVPDAVVVTKVHGGLTLQILAGDNNGGYAVTPSSFVSPFCGNGVLDTFELCDDGNRQSRDGCSASCTPELGRRITSIDAVDLDGDGNADLVVGSPPSALLLFGDGQGRFREIRKLTKIKSKTPIAIGDFDGDGAVDIVTMPSSGPGLDLFLNDGSGTFTDTPIYPSLRFIPPMLAADFDKNGLLDLVVAYKQKSALKAAVLYGDGGGPLQMRGSFTPPGGFKSLAAADFDEDGFLDVLATSRKSKAAPMLFRGSQDGTFSSGEPRPVNAPFATMTVTDLNEDLHQDAVFCNDGSGRSCVARYGDGKGALSALAPQIPQEARIGREMHALATIDMDGDGVLDFVSLSRRDERAVILFRDGSSSQTTRLELTTGTKPHSLAIGDLDGDGHPDIIVANQATDDLSIFLNHGGRQFESVPRICLPGHRNPITNACQGNLLPGAIALADLNGDQRLDVIVAETGVSKVALLLNLNNAFDTGGLADGGSLTTGASPVDLAVANLNDDGVPDLITADRDGNDVSIFLSAAGGGYGTTRLGSGGSQPVVVVVGDLNGDTHDDLTVVNMQANNVATFLNDGHGVLTFKKASPTRGRIVPKAACLADFDGDGKLDIAVASHKTKDILVLRGTGDGTWARDERVYHVDSDPVALVCIDLDKDGRTDIVFGNRRAGRVDFVHNDP
jgi:cysteine-rich repeat protein